MKHLHRAAGIVALLLFVTGCAPEPPAHKQPIRVVVIGGMVMSGMWSLLTNQFTEETGYPVKLVATGPKQVLIDAFHKGEADLLTMHSCDQATDLLADGYATGGRPWARNELVIVGPRDDPAHIKGMTDGAAALRKIAEAHASFVDFYSVGSRSIALKLWHKAGLMPSGAWVLKDESETPQGIVAFAQKKHAYVIVGRIPVLAGKMVSEGMEILVTADPDMRRPYVVLVANAQRFPRANTAGAQVLADYLLSNRGQYFMRDYASRQPDGVPLFYPISPD